WGADIIFEASGSPKAFLQLFDSIRPGGCVVLVGMPIEPVMFDVVAAAAKEVRIETVFRYANVFDRAIEMLSSGKLDLRPLISRTFSFDESVIAFERAAKGLPGDVKLQIKVDP
ncbi:MAG: NAD(P)-dependent alcohol dehydrogenase, partial [Mesorhizobium sp.]